MVGDIGLLPTTVNYFLYPQLLIQRADVNQSNDLSLAEFVNYVQEHEKRLLLVFHTLDANSDGMCSFVLLSSLQSQH